MLTCLVPIHVLAFSVCPAIVFPIKLWSDFAGTHSVATQFAPGGAHSLTVPNLVLSSTCFGNACSLIKCPCDLSQNKKQCLKCLACPYEHDLVKQIIHQVLHAQLLFN